MNIYISLHTYQLTHKDRLMSAMMSFVNRLQAKKSINYKYTDTLGEIFLLFLVARNNSTPGETFRQVTVRHDKKNEFRPKNMI